MKKLMVVFAFLIASLSPGFAQNQIDAATRQDVADLMELTGARERIPNIDSAMAGQFAAGFATRYQQPYPQRQPGGGSKASTEAAERFRQRMIGAMQAAQAVMNKHMPEIEAQIEKPAADTSQPALTRAQ